MPSGKRPLASPPPVREAPQLASEFPATIGAGLLRRLVSMPDAIEASRRAFTAASRGEITGPLRSSLSRQRVLIMPAEHSSGSGLIKVVSIQPDGWAEGQPSIGGGVLWIDGPTGRIAALVDAAALTALRTGAASGLATALLAPPACRVLAMLGAGGQAADQVAGVCAVRPIREVRVHSRRRQRSEELCERLRASHPGVGFAAAGTSRQAVRGADVICTATRSQTPLFEAGDLEPMAHINAVGAYRLDMCEIPAEAFRRAGTVVIDQLEAVLAEAGDLVQALEAGCLRQTDLVEMGQLLISGAPPAGPVSVGPAAATAAATASGPAGPPPARGLTIFKSVGIAAQDWSVCELAVRRARETGAIPGAPEDGGAAA
jgi:ornithine cyclodeaminase/alanine dehydrogenase-like protein (mu-crystallin family)